MTAPRFLTVDDVLYMHRRQIDQHGGSHGVRDRGLLESAIAQPSAMFGGQYLHADLFEMAAAYLFHLVQNHPFVDGNKRVGAVATLSFLRLNCVQLNLTDEGLVDLVLDVAQGKLQKPAIAEFLRTHSA